VADKASLSFSKMPSSECASSSSKLLLREEADQ
jgi:hypothetical protein